jgi:hypothetical protein
MTLRRLLVMSLLFSVGTSQSIAQESIRLRFGVVKDGSTVAKPEVAVISGSAAAIEVDDVGRIAFTPTFRGSDAVSVAFDIRSRGKQLQPRLVISKNEPGTLSWTSATRESVKLTVSWIR